MTGLVRDDRTRSGWQDSFGMAGLVRDDRTRSGGQTLFGMTTLLSFRPHSTSLSAGSGRNLDSCHFDQVEKSCFTQREKSCFISALIRLMDYLG